MKTINKIVICICLVIVLLTSFPISYAQSDSSLTFTNNGYKVIIDDQADLLNESEINALLPYMRTVTNHDGNVVFLSTNSNSLSSNSYAERQYKNLCGDTSGVAFLIDMNNHEICIFCNGDFSDKITSSKMDKIVDNIRRYATSKDCFSCAKEAFRQISRTTANPFLFSPMKLITSILLAISISLLGCIMLAYFQRRQNGEIRDITEGDAPIRITTNQTLVDVKKTVRGHTIHDYNDHQY